MAISLKCRMCGGSLEVAEGESIAECEYCGSKQTVPQIDDEKLMQLHARASKLLRACDFEKASSVYEQIVAENLEDAEAHWGIFLCRYGIEYVDDPAGAKVPTCHRSSFDSAMDDGDLEQACENADAAARRLYREQAKEIERLREAIVRISETQEPYDVFICYKETDPVTGERTLDSVLAQDVYKALTAEGYRTFFSRITLEGMLGADYEPVIFAALNSAKAMLVFGSDYEYFDAVWVKNEWSRFLKLAANDTAKRLIPCYRDIDPYDLPKEFRGLQGQDMGKVGAIQDLLHGVEKIVGGRPSKEESPAPVVQQVVAAGPQNEALLKRAQMALQDGEWNRVDEFCEQVLNSDAECAEAYLCKLMAKLKCAKLGDLGNANNPFDDDADCKKVVRFADDALKKEIADANEVIRERKHRVKCAEDYAAAEKLCAKAVVTKSDYDAVIHAYRALGDYRDAQAKVKFYTEEWGQIERHAETIRDAYVPPNKAKTTDHKTEAASVAAARVAMAARGVIAGLENVKERFPEAKADYEVACTRIAKIDAEKAALESELGGLGLFKGARKKEIAAQLEQLGKERSCSEASCDAAKAEMCGYADIAQIDSELASARSELEAARRHEAEAKEAEEAERKAERERETERAKARAALKAALADPKVLLHAESLKHGILDSMEDDPAVWPLVKRTPYLYGTTVACKREKRDDLLAGRFQMGKWRGAPLTWRMLKEEGGRALLVCSEVIEQRQYHGSNDDITWEKCDLRKWLNGEFLESAFSAAEQVQIDDSDIRNVNNSGKFCGTPFQTKGGANTLDKVFCLSFDEVRILFKDEADRMCRASAYVKKEAKVFQRDNLGADWWLRSPGYEQHRACVVDFTGGELKIIKFGLDVDHEHIGVRPAFWLNLKSLNL